MKALRRLIGATPSIVPAAAMLAGLLSALVYWLAAEIWPANVAVALAMAAASWTSPALTADPAQRARDSATPGPLFWVFALLVKYNALMALTAASGPLPLPAHLTLGLIMIAAQAAAGALAAPLTTGGANPALPAVTLALVVAFAPATLLGIPGLAGLVAAIVSRLLPAGAVLPRSAAGTDGRRQVAQQLAEACFYLGAVATWRYV